MSGDQEISNVTNPVIYLLAKPNTTPQWIVVILIIAFRKDFSDRQYIFGDE